MSRPVWLVGLIKKAFPARYRAAHATRLPVLGSIADHLFFAGDDLIYLPKDRVIPVNQAIESPGEMALPSEVVEHFVQIARVHWVMNTCICREANGCQDYPLELGCLFLGEATLGINSRLGRRVTCEEALAHVRLCREVGLVHLIGRNKLDTIWLGVGPGNRLLTICNCCPCCCLWRVLPHVAPHIGAKVSRMPGVTVAVNGRCTGCGLCAQGVCFVDAIQMTDGRAAISQACRGCGRCLSACPRQAIEISIDYERLVENSIARLSRVVDVA